MKKWLLRSIYIIVPLLIIAGVVWWIFKWSNSPQKGSIANGQSQSNLTSPSYTDKTLTGSYFQFQYSGTYTAKTETPTNGDIERYTLTSDATYDKRILANVTSMPADGHLESNGAYLLRSRSPKDYSQRLIQVNTGLVTVWVRTDGTEQTAMIPHGNKLAIVSLVTANANDNLGKEMDALLGTFKWLQ